MIIIKKNKRIIINISLIVVFGFIFISTMAYFFGWSFDLNSFLIYLAIISTTTILILFVCVILIKLNKKKFVFTKETVKLYNKNELIFELDTNDIENLIYIRFLWFILFQIGAGYLHMKFINNENIKPSIKFANGDKIYSLSVSLKEAKLIANLLDIKIKIK